MVTPVTDRRSSPGWTVARQSQPTLDCGDAEASASTVSANVYACSPTYAYAVACWPAVHGGHVLCLRDPWSHQVVEMSYAGHLSPVRPPSRPTPLALQLSDGARCIVRNGGAWGFLKGHPHMWGTYSCRRSAHGPHGEETILWGTGRSFGINTAARLWTVTESPDGGESGRIHHVKVTAAYFVGNPA